MNQELEPLGYSFSDVENIEKIMNDDYIRRTHDTNNEFIEIEREKVQFMLPITFLVF